MTNNLTGSDSQRDDDATDSRTLDDIEREEKDVGPTDGSATPSPDEGSGRSSDRDASKPM